MENLLCKNKQTQPREKMKPNCHLFKSAPENSDIPF